MTIGENSKMGEDSAFLPLTPLKVMVWKFVTAFEELSEIL